MEPVDLSALAHDPEPFFVEKAKHQQDKYRVLPCLQFLDGKVITEWSLSEEERLRLIRGERIRLTIHTFNHPLQPVLLEVTRPDES